MEVLLSQVRRCSRGARITLHGHESFTTPILHTFTSFPKDQSAAESLFSEAYSRGLNPQWKREIFPIVQVTMNPLERDNLPEGFIGRGFEGQIQEEYFPGSIVEASDTLIHTLDLTRQLNNEMKSLEILLEQEFPSKHQSYRSGLLNKILRNETVRTSPSVRERGTHLHSLRSEIEPYGSLTYDQEDHRMDVEIHDDDAISFVRKASLEELLAHRWLMLDIEIPRFTHDPTISWVGTTYLTPSGTLREMHTLRDIGASSLKGFTIYQYHSQEELIDGVKEAILRYDPAIISSYYAGFDFRKLREQGDFEIGDRDSPPLVKARVKPFERMIVPGRVVIDLASFGHFMSYLPNGKLETVHQHIMNGKSVGKSITYQQMEDLENLAMDGDTSAASAIGSYLADDVLWLEDIYHSERFKDYLSISHRLSSLLDIPMESLFQSPKNIQLAQKMAYRYETGVDYDIVYPIHKNRMKRIPQQTMFKDEQEADQQERRRKVRAVIDDAFKISPKPGIHNDVHVALVNYGKALKSIICRKFEPARQVFSLEHHNPDQRFALSVYSNALADFVLENYALWQEAHLINDPVKINRFKRRLWGVHGVDTAWITKSLSECRDNIHSLLSTDGRSIVYAAGPYLYFTGHDPGIAVNHLDRVLVTSDDQLHFKQHGHFRGVPKSPNMHFNQFEISTVGGFLDALFQRHYDDAFLHLVSNAKRLEEKAVSPSDLIFYQSEPRQLLGYVPGQMCAIPHTASFDPDWKRYSRRLDAKTQTMTMPILGLQLRHLGSMRMSHLNHLCSSLETGITAPIVADKFGNCYKPLF